MRRTRGGFALVVLAVACWPVPAEAGVYADDMTKCLVAATTEEDKVALVRWMFSAAAQHPAVKDLVVINEKQVEIETATAAKIFERLMTVSCAKQLYEAVKYEGEVAVTASFTAFGQVAGMSLMGDPSVARVAALIGTKLDKEKVQAVIEHGPK